MRSLNAAIPPCGESAHCLPAVRPRCAADFQGCDGGMHASANATPELMPRIYNWRAGDRHAVLNLRFCFVNFYAHAPRLRISRWLPCRGRTAPLSLWPEAFYRKPRGDANDGKLALKPSPCRKSSI